MAKERQKYLNPYNTKKNKLTNIDTNVEKEYFSGANVHVYFGDVYVEELASIEFSLFEATAPIYGYNSYTFDRMARGSRMVEGSFIVNFTENGYVQTILDRLTNRVEKGEGTPNQNYGAQNSYYQNNNRTDQTIRKISSNYSGEYYENYINSLKNNYWGIPSDSTVSNVGLSKDENPFWYGRQHGVNHNNPLRESGFNILIDYNPERNKADFENCLKNMGTGVSIYNTFRTIIGVHIKSTKQVLNNDGNVIQELFEFTARDLDGDIISSSLRYNFRDTLASESLHIPDDYKSSEKDNKTNNKNGIIIGSGGNRPIGY